MLVVLGLRGVATLLVLTTLVGGMPRMVQAALAVTVGLWSGVMIATAGPGWTPLTDATLAPLDALAVPTWALAITELALGAALGVLAAIPLLAAAAAGRLVDIAGSGRAQGVYGVFFGVLAAAVFVGIDGHVTVLTSIVESHRTLPTLRTAQPAVLGAIGALIPAAIQLAIPWLVTAAVVHIAIGVGTRVGTRVAMHAPVAAAVPAALAMMTAALVATLAVAIAALVRGTM